MIQFDLLIFFQSLTPQGDSPSKVEADQLPPSTWGVSGGCLGLTSPSDDPLNVERSEGSLAIFK